MPAQQPEWTADLARALPDDGKRYEVLDGELFVTPAPSLRHQLALKLLFDLLNPYVSEHRVGELLWSPADIEFSPRRLVQPDLFVVRLNDGGRPRSWREVRGLVLAIEALSSSTAYADRHKKRVIYTQEDVGEYWIVDLDARLCERWRMGDARPEMLGDALVWQPDAAIAPLSIDFAKYFANVLD